MHENVNFNKNIKNCVSYLAKKVSLELTMPTEEDRIFFDNIEYFMKIIQKTFLSQTFCCLTLENSSAREKRHKGSNSQKYLFTL